MATKVKLTPANTHPDNHHSECCNTHQVLKNDICTKLLREQAYQLSQNVNIGVRYAKSLSFVLFGLFLIFYDENLKNIETPILLKKFISQFRDIKVSHSGISASA